MKNISEQDHYFSEQVKTSLKNSIPEISKNIHESLSIKSYSPGLKGVGERVGLFGKQILHTLGREFYAAMARGAAKNKMAVQRTSSNILYPKYGTELGISPAHIANVMRTYPRDKPDPPPKTILGKKNQHYSRHFAIYAEKMRQYEERKKLEGSIRNIQDLNRPIGSYARSTNRQLGTYGEVGDEFAQKAIDQARKAAIVSQLRQRKSRRSDIHRVIDALYRHIDDTRRDFSDEIR